MPVPSHQYDREYFLSNRCEGFDRFKDDRGLSRVKTRQLRLLAPGPGMRVLDAGCGRGEFLLACAGLGADIAGIDYAEPAVEISRETLAGVEGADLRQGDVTALPWADGSFDRILFADVIEHLDPDQAVAGLRELRRVLRPGGLLLVHTAPNLLFLKVAWPVMRPLLRLLDQGKVVEKLDSWVADGRRWHVYEQTVYSLRRELRAAGFERSKVWIDPDVLRQGEHHLLDGIDELPFVALASRVAAARPIRLFLGNDLFALARKGA